VNAAVAEAENSLTSSQRAHISQRYQNLEHRPDDTPSFEAEHPKAKGKGIDPREWGNLDINDDEADADAQRIALEQFNRNMGINVPPREPPPPPQELIARRTTCSWRLDPSLRSTQIATLGLRRSLRRPLLVRLVIRLRLELIIRLHTFATPQPPLPISTIQISTTPFENASSSAQGLGLSPEGVQRCVRHHRLPSLREGRHDIY
jgi:hypothetical protein